MNESKRSSLKTKLQEIADANDLLASSTSIAVATGLLLVVDALDLLRSEVSHLRDDLRRREQAS